MLFDPESQKDLSEATGESIHGARPANYDCTTCPFTCPFMPNSQASSRASASLSAVHAKISPMSRSPPASEWTECFGGTRAGLLHPVREKAALLVAVLHLILPRSNSLVQFSFTL